MRVWIATAVVTVLALLAWEWGLREAGYRPDISDDKLLWSSVREQASAPGRTPLVLLGASRVLLNVSLPELGRQFPHNRVLQLAVNGRYPMAALADLAHDPAFSGIVLLGNLSQGFERNLQWSAQQPWVDYYQQAWNWNKRAERWLWNALEQASVMAGSRTSVWRFLEHYWRHQIAPPLPFTATALDRSIAADYQTKSLPWVKAKRIRDKARDYAASPPSAPADWLRGAQAMNDDIEAIHRRGGLVILLRFPTSGRHWELDEQHYPRAQYWDRLQAATPAAVLHFQDIEGLADFALPDTSHLDFRDRKAFTQRLAAAIRDTVQARRPELIGTLVTGQ